MKLEVYFSEIILKELTFFIVNGNISTIYMPT